MSKTIRELLAGNELLEEGQLAKIVQQVDHHDARQYLWPLMLAEKDPQSQRLMALLYHVFDRFSIEDTRAMEASEYD